MEKFDLPVRSINRTCTSGDTSGIIVPDNMIAHVKEIEIDSAAISGNASTITIQILDKYTPTGGSLTTKVRKQVSVDCGGVEHIDTKGDIPVFTRGDIRSNISGPIVSLAYALE